MKKLMIGVFIALAASCRGGRFYNHQEANSYSPELDRLDDSLRYASLLKEMDSTELGDTKSIYGLWFIPHEADICIVLHKNHTFEDYTYRINKDSSITDVVIKGSFYMKGDSLMMKGENGGVKKLRHWKSGDDDNYYLTKGKGTGVGNWYVKEDDPY